MDIENDVMDHIEQKRLIWHGHVRKLVEIGRLISLRMESHKKMSRGRPRTSWRYEVVEANGNS